MGMMGATRIKGNNNLLLMAGSLNPVNHREEVPLAGEIELKCGCMNLK